ncbi:hypothetical protein [Salsipaludibacter albus]|uniref:hypothetical protein n=1 Tax=Salsipaludibacter albus TaxID=2849650 RepID=UPI001EE47BBF|nr:hypothetical protein [Salsipaludibacter albus]MBY5163154.1 hypothetical protein [Salsipaludibacter albus]
MAPKPRAVVKPLAARISELLQGLLVVRDASAAINAGKTYQAIALSGQIRALLLERRKDASPLLLTILEELGLSHQIFVMPSYSGPDLPSPKFHVLGPPITRTRVLTAQVPLALGDLGAHPVVSVDGEEFDLAFIVRLLANKGGGAHYSKTMPTTFAWMLELASVPALQIRNAIVSLLGQVGEALTMAGVEMLHQTAAWEVFIDVGVPAPSEGSFIEYIHPSLPMGLSVGLTKNRQLAVEARGIDAARAIVVVEDLLDWGESHQIHIQLTHGDNLSAKLFVSVDGDTVRSTVSSEVPVFLPISSIKEFNLHVNGAEGGSWNGSIALGSMFARSLGPSSEDAKSLLAMRSVAEDPDRKAVLYKVGSTGFSASGQGDISNSDGVVMSRMSSALKRESPPEAS